MTGIPIICHQNEFYNEHLHRCLFGALLTSSQDFASFLFPNFFLIQISLCSQPSSKIFYTFPLLQNYIYLFHCGHQGSAYLTGFMSYYPTIHMVFTSQTETLLFWSSHISVTSGQAFALIILLLGCTVSTCNYKMLLFFKYNLLYKAFP